MKKADARDEHFYQLGLRQFGALGRLQLEPAPQLQDLLRLAAEDEPLAEHGLTIDNVVSVCLLSLSIRPADSRKPPRSSSPSVR